MSHNAEEGKPKLKKQLSNAGFFSMTLPAAFQRVFKKQSTTKEVTMDDSQHVNTSTSTSSDHSIHQFAAQTTSNDDEKEEKNNNNNNESIKSTSEHSLNNESLKSTNDHSLNNDKKIKDNINENSLINEKLNENNKNQVFIEDSITLHNDSAEISHINLVTNAAYSDTSHESTIVTQSSNMDVSNKINSLNSDEDDDKNDKVVPLRGILISSRNDDSLLDSSYSNRSKKNVSFNVTVLSEQYAPPNLFYEERSNQVILKNYLKSCEKYKIKPLDKIITQINDFELKTNRELKIDLKGCRLDYKQCECLEEVFRYVRTQWLDISNTFLEDDGCMSICEMCEYYETATHICLSGNTRISNRGWLSVSQLMQKSTCLEYLDLSRTIFTEQMLHILVRAFRTYSSIKILHLEGCYLNGVRLQIILSAISSNKNIKELYLAENKITASDANCLFDLLVSNDNVKVLDLRNNSLQDNGLIKLSQGLLQQTNAGVEVLHLWNNSITANGIQGFVHVLSLHPSLHTLNLGRNKIGDEGILMIKFNLIKNKHLQRLGLSNNRITNTGAVALAELIADSTKLMRLDLRENSIGLAGLIALSQAMQVNYSVFKLDFNRNIKVDPEMTELVTRLVDDVRICCLRNRQLAKGGPMDEIISLTSVLSDDHSITESLKTIPPNELPSPQKSADGTMSSFWQILSKFTKARNTTSIASIIAKTEEENASSSNTTTPTTTTTTTPANNNNNTTTINNNIIINKNNNINTTNNNIDIINKNNNINTTNNNIDIINENNNSIIKNHDNDPNFISQHTESPDFSSTILEDIVENMKIETNTIIKNGICESINFQVSTFEGDIENHHKTLTMDDGLSDKLYSNAMNESLITTNLSGDVDAVSKNLSTDFNVANSNMSRDVNSLSSSMSTDFDIASNNLSADVVNGVSNNLSADLVDSLSNNLSTNKVDGMRSNVSTRFDSAGSNGGVGRFSISRVVEKYHYKSNYPIGTHCEDTSSTDKSYEIHQQDISIDNEDQDVVVVDGGDDDIYIKSKSSSLIDDQTSITQLSDE